MTIATGMAILDLIVLYLPTILAVIASLGSIFKIFRAFSDLRSKVDTSESDRLATEQARLEAEQNLRDEIKVVLQQNAELKRDMADLLKKYDHIRRDE